MPKTAAIIVTETDDGHFTVLDAGGNVHEASSEEALGAVCRAIMDNPELPQYETVDARVAGLEDMAVRVAEVVLPEDFGFMAEPAVGMLKKMVTSLQKRQAKSVPVRIRSTEEDRQEGIEAAKKRREEKNRLKALARQKAAERRGHWSHTRLGRKFI